MAPSTKREHYYQVNGISHDDGRKDRCWKYRHPPDDYHTSSPELSGLHPAHPVSQLLWFRIPAGLLQQTHCKIVFMNQHRNALFGPPISSFQAIPENVTVYVFAIVICGKQEANPLFLITWM